MTWWDYDQSKQISKDDPAFYALIMSAMRKADSHNMMMLSDAFPSVYEELKERYNAPGGVLDTDPASVQIKVLGRVVNDNT